MKLEINKQKMVIKLWFLINSLISYFSKVILAGFWLCGAPSIDHASPRFFVSQKAFPWIFPKNIADNDLFKLWVEHFSTEKQIYESFKDKSKFLIRCIAVHRIPIFGMLLWKHGLSHNS